MIWPVNLLEFSKVLVEYCKGSHGKHCVYTLKTKLYQSTLNHLKLILCETALVRIMKVVHGKHRSTVPFFIAIDLSVFPQFISSQDIYWIYIRFIDVWIHGFLKKIINSHMIFLKCKWVDAKCYNLLVMKNLSV